MIETYFMRQYHLRWTNCQLIHDFSKNLQQESAREREQPLFDSHPFVFKN